MDLFVSMIINLTPCLKLPLHLYVYVCVCVCVCVYVQMRFMCMCVCVCVCVQTCISSDTLCPWCDANTSDTKRKHCTYLCRVTSNTNNATIFYLDGVSCRGLGWSLWGRCPPWNGCSPLQLLVPPSPLCQPVQSLVEGPRDRVSVRLGLGLG